MGISLKGLDLSFMRKPDAGVQPGRYVVDPATGDCVRKRARPPSEKRSGIACPYFMPDVDAVYGGAWKSIVDGSQISSRSNWKEHNKRNGVIDVGDKFWAEDGDDIRVTEEKMGYDPSLIGNSETFSWIDPKTT
jgi:hypothetical protein